jgi:hypothetical protein
MSVTYEKVHALSDELKFPKSIQSILLLKVVLNTNYPTAPYPSQYRTPKMFLTLLKMTMFPPGVGYLKNKININQ